jgi:hypothetical protein
VKFSFIKIKKKKKKKTISTLIARDKLPVHTILEQHEQEFVTDPLECNCQDGLNMA